MDTLADAGQRMRIRVILEVDGPNAHFFARAAEPDLFTELLVDHPDLSLCIDTGRLALLARQHGGDPLEYTRRWLTFAKHLHLHGTNWDQRANHLPPLPEHEGLPGHAPAAEMARLVLSSHPETLVVLETDASALSQTERERSLRFCESL